MPDLSNDPGDYPYFSGDVLKRLDMENPTRLPKWLKALRVRPFEEEGTRRRRYNEAMVEALLKITQWRNAKYSMEDIRVRMLPEQFPNVFFPQETPADDPEVFAEPPPRAYKPGIIIDITEELTEETVAGFSARMFDAEGNFMPDMPYSVGYARGMPRAAEGHDDAGHAVMPLYDPEALQEALAQAIGSRVSAEVVPLLTPLLERLETQATELAAEKSAQAGAAAELKALLMAQARELAAVRAELAAVKPSWWRKLLGHGEPPRT